METVNIRTRDSVKIMYRHNNVITNIQLNCGHIKTGNDKESGGKVIEELQK